jgi:uncharacterized protein with HEPN domain
MTAKRQYFFYLEDILTSMLRILEYTENMTLDEFRHNQMVVDAVVRNFEIIGEASKNIPEEIKIRYPEVPWKKMYGLRNLISHQYFGVDYEMIWEIARSNLPNNINDLRKVVANESKK